MYTNPTLPGRGNLSLQSVRIWHTDKWSDPALHFGSEHNKYNSNLNRSLEVFSASGLKWYLSATEEKQSQFYLQYSFFPCLLDSNTTDRFMSRKWCLPWCLQYFQLSAFVQASEIAQSLNRTGKSDVQLLKLQQRIASFQTFQDRCKKKKPSHSKGQMMMKYLNWRPFVLCLWYSEWQFFWITV